MHWKKAQFYFTDCRRHTHTYICITSYLKEYKNPFVLFLQIVQGDSTSQIDVDCIRYGDEELVEGCCPNHRYESISVRNFNVCRSVFKRNSRRRHL